VELNIDVDVFGPLANKELHILLRCEVARVRHACLEVVQVLVDIGMEG
jgi:hypothetical protein